MEKIIKEIIEKNTHCVFASPHLDDAIFSAGGLISRLAKYVPVTVINVFTSTDNGPYTLSARRQLKKCGYKSAKTFINDRIQEDEKALSSIQVGISNLNYFDAIYRKKNNQGRIKRYISNLLPSLKHLYPTYRFHIVSGNIHEQDLQLIDSIANSIQKVVSTKENFQIFCPIGFGNHVDHLIVREACRKIFKDSLMYWADVPYFSKSNEINEFFKINNFEYFEYRQTSIEKKTLCQFYKNQINSVFPEKDELLNSEFYFKETNKVLNSEILTSTVLSSEIESEWKSLWKTTTENQTLFNSFEWFDACLKTFKYNEVNILRYYIDQKLVGLLPLVRDNKLFFTKYEFAGKNYLDKSPILTSKNITDITANLVNQISTNADVSLDEISPIIHKILSQKINNNKSATRSKSYYAPLSNNPYSFIKVKAKRNVEKILGAYGKFIKNISCVGNISSYLNIMKEIEASSSKALVYKSVLSNKYTIKLLTELEKRIRDLFWINILYYKEQPVAYLSAYLVGKTCYGSLTAYRQDYKYLSPGKLMMYLTLPELYKIGVATIDYSRGESDYKKDLTPFSYSQYSIFISNNIIRRSFWHMYHKAMANLANHRSIYEKVRIYKNIIQKIFSSNE